MSTEWRTISLGEICKFSAGSAFKPEYQGQDFGDYPFIKVSDMNIVGNELFINNAQNYVNESHRAAMKAKLHPAGATVFAKIGVALTTNRRRLLIRPTIVDNNMMSATPMDGEVTSRFLYLLLTSLDFNTISAGTALPYLNVSDLEKIEVSVPSDLNIQRVIERAVGALDDKIDLNRRINQTLEAMAQAIFKSWFVDFDPVKAKIAAIEQGQDPLRAAMRAISGKTDAELDQMPREHHDQLAATAALFPDAMEESELGDIPKGWETLSFGDVAQQSKGVVNPGASLKASFTHYSLPAFDASQLPIVESGESIKSNKTPVPDNAVLVSKLNPHIPRIWLVGRAGERAVCSTEFIVWVPKFPANSAFVYGLASLSEFNIAMRQLVTGTSNSHQRVKPGQLAEIRVFVADKKTIAQYSATLAPLMEKVLCNRKEARRLAQLRDTLLPKLLSGELSVENLHKEVAV